MLHGIIPLSVCVGTGRLRVDRDLSDFVGGDDPARHVRADEIRPYGVDVPIGP